MDILEAIQTRHSVRDFLNRPVPKETVVSIMEAATRSPSSGNGQPWEIFIASGATLDNIRQVVLERAARAAAAPAPLPPSASMTVFQQRFATSKRERLELMGMNPDDPQAYNIFNEWAARLYGAPVVAVICQDKSLSSTLDIGLLVQTICLAAMHFNVDTLIATNFVTHPDLLRDVLDISESLNIITGVGLGYANPASIINSYRSSRRPIEEVVRYKG